MIADRLASALPEGFSVLATGSRVRLFSDAREIGGSPASEIVEDDDNRTLDERLEVAILATLEEIQDRVIEELRDQWPVASSGRVARAFTAIQDGAVNFGFGDDDDPMHVRVLPIASADVVLGLS